MQLANSIKFVGAVLVGCAAAINASAQTAPWPSKPIRLIVAVPAGNAPDLVARILGEKMSRALGQQIVVDNRPGAGGIVALNLLKAAPADGHTLVLAHSSMALVTPLTYKEANFDSEQDFETIAIVGKTPMMFVANVSHPVKTLAEAVAMAKSQPEQVTFGNPNRTSIPHLAAELAAQRAGGKFQQVPFSNSAQGIQAVVNGDIALYSDGVGPLIQLVKGGRVKALAITSEAELPGLEGIPLANKAIPGLNVYGWFMLQAPKGTPAAVVQRLNVEANKAMQEQDVVVRLREFGTYPTPGNAADSLRFLASERAVYGAVIRALGIKAE